MGRRLVGGAKAAGVGVGLSPPGGREGPFCWDLNQPISIPVPDLPSPHSSPRSCRAELTLRLRLSWSQLCHHPWSPA